MRKINYVMCMILFFLSSCEKQSIWEFKVLPETCYADAFYVRPDFKPRGYKVELKGTLNQDLLLTIITSHAVDNMPNGKKIGLNYVTKLRKGNLNYSDSAAVYDDDLKIILSGSDTTLYPNPESKGTFRCAPLGDIKIKLTLQ